MARSLVIVVCWDSLLGGNKNNPGRLVITKLRCALFCQEMDTTPLTEFHVSHILWTLMDTRNVFMSKRHAEFNAAHVVGDIDQRANGSHYNGEYDHSGEFASRA